MRKKHKYSFRGKPKSQSSKLITAVCAILLLLSAVMIFTANQRAHLYSDDYMYSFRFNPGFATTNPDSLQFERIDSPGSYYQSLKDLYLNFTGRIVAHGMLQALLLLPSWVFDILNTLALFALTLLMTLWVVGRDKSSLLPYWLLFTMLYYLAVSYTIRNFYFPAFSLNYIWTQLIVFTFLLPFLRLICSAQIKWRGVGIIIGMFLLGLIAGDTNEPVVPAVLLAIGSYGIWRMVAREKLPAWYISAIIGMLAGFAFMYLAPGNSGRAAYESQNVGTPGIGFSLMHLKPMLVSSLRTAPAVLLAMVGLLGFRLQQRREDVLSFVFVLLLLGGTVFALLFVPFYIARMSILFVGFIIILCLMLLRGSKFNTAGWIMSFILVLLPIYAAKVSADYTKLDRGDREYGIFLDELGQCEGDSCLVSPRAHVDPITRANWVKPMATYHGLQHLWVKDELDSLFTGRWKPAEYHVHSKLPEQEISLQALRYVEHNRYSRTLYVLLELDTTAVNPDNLILSLYSADIQPRFLRRMIDRLPTRLLGMLLTSEQSFRPLRHVKQDGYYVYALPMRIETGHEDYLRLRIDSSRHKVQDLYLTDVKF